MAHQMLASGEMAHLVSQSFGDANFQKFFETLAKELPLYMYTQITRITIFIILVTLIHASIAVS